MESFIDDYFKDDSPLNTVEKIKKILKSNGIEIEEHWIETKVPYCFSLKLSIKGLNFETSGKGLSRELTLASAYGEMIERVQLGFLGKRATQKDGSYSMNDSQDVQISLKELLASNMQIYQKMSDHHFEWSGKRIFANDIVAQYADEKENISVTPFVDLMQGEIVYIPSKMRKAMYTSNGCAAGNTIEEAIVQALSEIVERFYRLRIIKENICVPQIPDAVLEKYETAYKIIEYVRSKGYKVWVKDCSLGDSFPVVCVCYVSKRTGKYHTHFGAYPVFEIALTRALTETFQGRSVDSFASHEGFFYNEAEKDFIYNISQELTYGTAKRLPEFFVGQIKFEYNSKIGFKGKNNRELLKECIEFFKNKGFDILVRNSSCLGFPTVQVIIPGYSETYMHRLSKDTDENRYLAYAVKTLRDPSKATVSDMLCFLMHKAETEKYVTHPGKSGFLASAKIMAQITKEEESFLLLASMAYVNFVLGRYAAAGKNVDDILKLYDGTKEEFLVCCKRYLDLKARKYEAGHIEELLRLFHNEETIELFYQYINNNKNIFDEFVLHCDLNCSDSCILKHCCCQKKVQKLIDLINEKTSALKNEEFLREIQDLSFLD